MGSVAVFVVRSDIVGLCVGALIAGSGALLAGFLLAEGMAILLRVPMLDWLGGVCD